MSQPDGIPATAAPATRSWREVARSLRPWKRRLIGLLVTWVVIAGVTVAFGTSPNVPVLLAVLAALAMLLWHVVDHAEAHHLTAWPLVDGELGGQGRGNDFRVTNLAGRLAAANVAKEGREALVHDLHVQLQVLIRERLYAKHGLVAEEEPRWSEGVTPPELWQLLVGLPPPDLYRPDRLDPLLTRLEKW
ncbi:hypothetical protein [Humibacillus xanthopallidus]|uniref:hypothetical protein n=1 Tax=Humibacillus xanthopallidus TaxID=412689 RepID=UPI001FE8167D|nr:hypothetical protein [Humibacillus xanthopallidus]HET7801060.1 hypothetical protein [Humibacillus xanthopallidus]